MQRKSHHHSGRRQQARPGTLPDSHASRAQSSPTLLENEDVSKGVDTFFNGT